MTFQTQVRLPCFALLMLAIVGCGGGGSSGSGTPPIVPIVPVVPAAPSIDVQPAAVTVADGATATFNVTASGTAPLSYQWRRNGVDLVNSGTSIVGATSATLALTAPYSFNASQMSVQVTNAAGIATSNNALLTVTPTSPTIAAQPINVSVAVGMPANFSVSVSGGTAPVTYQWKRNGSVIGGAVAATYSLTTVAGDNGASFSVAITNPAGTLTSSPAILTVTGPAKSWGPVALLNGNNADADANYPDVAIDASGNAIAVWMEIDPNLPRYAVLASRYSAGSSWSTAVGIDGGGVSAAKPVISMTPSGLAFVAFTATGGGVNDILTTRFDGVWHTVSRTEFDDFHNAFDPDIAVSSTGAATAVFTQSDGTGARAWVNQATAAGVWSLAVLRGHVFVDKPQVAVAANGHAVMTWSEDSNAGRFARSLWASRNIGTGWSAPALLATDMVPLQSNINLGIDAQGNAIAVWSHELAMKNVVRAVQLSDATGVWTAPVTLNDGAHDALSPQIAVSSDGKAIVAWSESDLRALGDFGIRSSRFDPTAGTWSAAIAVQPSSAKPGSFPNVGIDDAGNAIASWLQPIANDPLRRELWAAHFTTTNSTWAAPIKLMTDANAYVQSDYQAKLAVNGNGEAVVTWSQRTDLPRTVGIWARVFR